MKSPLSRAKIKLIKRYSRLRNDPACCCRGRCFCWRLLSTVDRGDESVATMPIKLKSVTLETTCAPSSVLSSLVARFGKRGITRKISRYILTSNLILPGLDAAEHVEVFFVRLSQSNVQIPGFALYFSMFNTAASRRILKKRRVCANFYWQPLEDLLTPRIYSLLESFSFFFSFFYFHMKKGVICWTIELEAIEKAKE